MPFVIATLGTQIAPEGVAILEQAGASLIATPAYPSRADLLALLARHNPDALIIRLIEHLDGELMDAAPNLKLIAKHGAGTNDIDIAAAAARNIPVIMATGANAHSVAEHALGLILALTKDFAAQDRHIRAGRWDKKLYAGRELRGQKLGLVGFGLIGQILARMAQPLGLLVAAYDPYAPDSAFDGMTRVTDLDALLATSDIVSLHTPLTTATRGLINASRIALMQPHALFINTARGEVVDEPALTAALAAKKIAGAGLDSFAEEPPQRSPLWDLGNVILTPHVAGVTEDAKRAVSTLTAQNVLHVLRGEAVEPRYFVKPS